MKQEDTKQKILDKALELFSARGYDCVSVGQIAAAVGIKAPSLYNHFPSKQAIFDAIVEATAAQYEADTDRIDIHVQNAGQDVPVFTEITADRLYDKVRQIFEYSLHNAAISRFRRMMTIEQFRSPELAALYSRRYVERVLRYHAGIFRALIASGEIRQEDPDALALHVCCAGASTLIGVCDRAAGAGRREVPGKAAGSMCELFFRMVHATPQKRIHRKEAKSMKKTLVQKLGLLGVLSFLSYAAAVFVSPLAYPGYNPLAQAVSDLSAADAPSLALWNRLSAGYNVCEVVCATVVCIGMQNRKTKLLRTGVRLFALMQWISAIGYRMFPLSTSGYAGTFQDAMHMATTAVVVLLSIVSLSV